MYQVYHFSSKNISRPSKYTPKRSESTAKAESCWTAGLLYMSYAAAKVSKLVLVFRFSRGLERGDWRKILGTCGWYGIYRGFIGDLYRSQASIYGAQKGGSFKFLSRFLQVTRSLKLTPRDRRLQSNLWREPWGWRDCCVSCGQPRWSFPLQFSWSYTSCRPMWPMARRKLTGD